MRNWLMALLVVIVAWPAAATAKDKDYVGPDAGYLVYSVGNVGTVGLDFSFTYRPASSADSRPAANWKGIIEPRIGGAFYLKVKNPDFTGEEIGHVVIRRLPPGRYAVDNFHFGGHLPGVGSFAWKPSRPFAMPFEIRRGEATYIGSFMRGVAAGSPAGFFVVADRSERDLPLARRRLPAEATIASEVTDVSTFEIPMLRAR